MSETIISPNYSSWPVFSVNRGEKKNDESTLSIEDKGVSRKELLRENVGEKVKNALNKLRNFAKQNPDEAGAVTGTVGFLTGAAIGANERANELEKELETIRGTAKKHAASRTDSGKAGAPSTECAIIAQDALETLDGLKEAAFARELGNRYLDLILNKKLNDTERFLAQLARENTDSKAPRMAGESAARLQKCIFKILSDGITGSPNATLLRAAREVADIGYFPEAATRRMLDAFLDQMSRNCTDQNEAKALTLFQEVIAKVEKSGLSRYDSRATDDETAVALQKVALLNIESLATGKNSAPLVNLLPAIALESRGAVSDDYHSWLELRCSVGRVFLDAIIKESPSGKVTMLAQVARNFSESQWRGDEEDAQKEALKKIKEILTSEKEAPAKKGIWFR